LLGLLLGIWIGLAGLWLAAGLLLLLVGFLRVVGLTLLLLLVLTQQFFDQSFVLLRLSQVGLQFQRLGVGV
jgi:hypothetical protein